MDHLKTNALIRAVYGLAAREESEHLAACPHCAGMLAEFSYRREITGNLELSEAFWRRQQEEILACARRPQFSMRRRLLATAALAALLITGLLALRNSPQPPPFTVEDEKFLSQVQSVANRMEPRALAPARLFLPKEVHP